MNSNSTLIGSRPNEAPDNGGGIADQVWVVEEMDREETVVRQVEDLVEILEKTLGGLLTEVLEDGWCL